MKQAKAAGREVNRLEELGQRLRSERTRRISKIVIVAVLLAPSCQDYRFRQVCPARAVELNKSISAVKPTPADILFVVDNSGSMADEQENLAVNFDRFINEIAGAGDYRIAVVSTDQGSPNGEQSGLARYAFQSSFPKVLQNVDSEGCSAAGITHGCFRGPASEQRLIDSSTMDRPTQIAAFQQNVRVGSCGSGNEQGLSAMASALRQSSAGQCNEGFLRAEANLVIIFVSDEEDSSGPARGQLTPVGQFVADLAQHKSYAEVRVAAIVGAIDGEPAQCATAYGSDCGRSVCESQPPEGSLAPCDGTSPCPQGEYCNTQDVCQNEVLRYWSNCHWCSYYAAEDCCSALPGSRYVQFARAIEAEVSAAVPDIPATGCRSGGGERIACLVDAICQENFGDTLARIARELVLPNSYQLDEMPPYPEGVAVRITGGRFGETGVDLTYGTDFKITANEKGALLTITAGDKTPLQDESVEIYVVMEHEEVGGGRGACAL